MGYYLNLSANFVNILTLIIDLFMNCLLEAKCIYVLFTFIIENLYILSLSLSLSLYIYIYIYIYIYGPIILVDFVFGNLVESEKKVLILIITTVKFSLYWVWSV